MDISSLTNLIIAFRAETRQNSIRDVKKCWLPVYLLGFSDAKSDIFTVSNAWNSCFKRMKQLFQAHETVVSSVWNSWFEAGRIGTVPFWNGCARTCNVYLSCWIWGKAGVVAWAYSKGWKINFWRTLFRSFGPWNGQKWGNCLIECQ